MPRWNTDEVRDSLVAFIAESYRLRGAPPTFGEMRSHLGVTHQSVLSHVRALHDQGRIVYTPRPGSRFVDISIVDGAGSEAEGLDDILSRSIRALNAEGDRVTRGDADG